MKTFETRTHPFFPLRLNLALGEQSILGEEIERCYPAHDVQGQEQRKCWPSTGPDKSSGHFLGKLSWPLIYLTLCNPDLRCDRWRAKRASIKSRLGEEAPLYGTYLTYLRCVGLSWTDSHRFHLALVLSTTSPVLGQYAHTVYTVPISIRYCYGSAFSNFHSRRGGYLRYSDRI